MKSLMRRPRRWRRGHQRAISEIVGTVFLLGLTLTAGVILWSFRFNFAAAPPSVTFQIRSGGANPVWGDPTDCQPQGAWSYSSPPSSKWYQAWWNQCDPQPPNLPTGNFSMLNTTSIIIGAVSSTNIPLQDITFSFICHNSTATGGTTVLVTGSLAAMSWFPGQSLKPSVSNPPTLGYCGNFNANGYGGGAYGTLYNRLGIFVPMTPKQTNLQTGDTFLLYIHNGGWPLDYECAIFGGCTTATGAPYYGPIMDQDDYHGAPPWCFTSVSACTIQFTYTGSPATTLASIPVYTLAPPSTQ